MRRWWRIVFLLVPVAALVLLWPGSIRIPDRWNPWAPLDLTQPPGFLTGYKLARLKTHPAACRAVLATSEFRYKFVPDRAVGQGCHFQNVVQVSRSQITYGSGFAATCPLAVGLALFERHAVQPTAEAVFGEPVVAIEHYGTFACRNINNAEGGRRSQHASANAIDIAGFRLRDGRQITVRADWDDGGDRGRFLKNVHDKSCRIFSAVLGPEYNAAHRDHFHLDLGRYSMCR
jgi:hypothetical protein